MEMPYCSIRLIQRWEEAYDDDQQQQAQQETPDPVRDEKLKQQLAEFLRLDDDG